MTEILKDELTLLKERADKMGITYHPSIGIEKLKEKIDEALCTTNSTEVKAEEVDAGGETESQRRTRLNQEARILRRVRITCMNPNRKAWTSDVFSLSNSVIGTIKRCVPFDTEEGTHVEDIIVEHIKSRMFRTSYVVKDSRGREIRRNKLVKEYAVEELPPLTLKELEALAQRQAQTGAIDN